MSLGNIEFATGPDLVLKPFRFRALIMDMPLLITLLAISGLGFVVLYSAVGADEGLHSVRAFAALSR